jgi:hypothetical protein
MSRSKGNTRRRDWIDLACFWPRLPIFDRLHRDADYIAALAAEVKRFNDYLQRFVEKIRNYRGCRPMTGLNNREFMLSIFLQSPP